jgi:hypothetical protein
MPKVGKAVSDTGDQNKPRSHTTNVRFGSIPLKNSFLQVDWKFPAPWPNYPKIELGGQSLPRYFAV